MTRRPRRPLSAEEARLWAEVARSVMPFSGRRIPEAPPLPAEPPVASQPKREARPTPGPGPGPGGPVRPPAPPPLAPLERRVVRALARGRSQTEGTLDLHGLTQAEAHARLLGFLHRSQASGHSLVLVITGRGREGEEGRGVLRRMVPHWLGLPELRAVVVGFQEAGTRQGGAGALYIRLRRRRS